MQARAVVAEPPAAMSTGAAVVLKSSMASSNGTVELVRTSFTTMGAGSQLLAPGEAVCGKLAMVAEPSGKRPCEMPCVCAPKVTASSAVSPSTLVRTMVSPPELSLKLQWCPPCLELSATNFA